MRSTYRASLEKMIEVLHYVTKGSIISVYNHKIWRINSIGILFKGFESCNLHDDYGKTIKEVIT